MKRIFLLLSLAACVVAAGSCGQKWVEESKDGYNLVTQKGGQKLGYSPDPDPERIRL